MLLKYNTNSFMLKDCENLQENNLNKLLLPPSPLTPPFLLLYAFAKTLINSPKGLSGQSGGK